MSATALLYWISARGQGSWSQFRAAVEELHVNSNGDEDGENDNPHDQFVLPLYQQLRLNLQRIGHVEFFAGASEGADWRVTPPTLALTRNTSHCLGALIGARSLSLLQRLTAAANATNIQTASVPGFPDQILITAPHYVPLVNIAQHVGLIVQEDAPMAVLSSLPAIDDPLVLDRTSLPIGTGWAIDYFNPHELSWRPATQEQAATASFGLFRFAFRHQRQLFICRRGSAFRVPGQVGKYLVLKRAKRRVIRYCRATMMLTVPASCRPPFLIERSLVLCSGVPPTHDPNTKLLQYTEIPQEIARVTAALLRQ